MSEEEKIREINVTQNKMIHLHVEKKKFTQSKNKRPRCALTFHELMIKRE